MVMSRLQPLFRPRRAGAPDGHALLREIEAAGSPRSSRRLLATYAAYERLKGAVEPTTWHHVAGLREFAKRTAAFNPFIPDDILERAAESEGWPSSPRAFAPEWIKDGMALDRMVLDPAAFMETIRMDGEKAAEFSQKNLHDAGYFFARYAQWHHSVMVAGELGAERVIDLGASNTDFAEHLTRRHPGVTVCAVSPGFPDGLADVADRVYRYGAPPTELALFEDASVDLVVAHAAFERLLGDEDSAAIAEVERVLVRGGRFLVAPFLVASHHALTLSPFSCFVANGDVDFAGAIAAEMASESARIDFNHAIITPLSRRYETASVRRRLLAAAPQLSARLRTFDFAPDGFGPDGHLKEDIFGMNLPQGLFDQRVFLAMEFIKH